MNQNSGPRPRLIEYLNKRKRLSFSPETTIKIARNHPPFLYSIDLMKILSVHDKCVNTVVWNRSGDCILSGSDDQYLCISKPGDLFERGDNYSVAHKIKTRHLGNIFCAQFMPFSADSLLISSSSEGPVLVHDINLQQPSESIFTFNCHSSVIYKVKPLYNSDKIFFSCGEDRTVRLFDLRCHKSCPRSSTCPHPPLIKNSYATTTLDVHPFNPNLLLIGRSDGLGLVYDRRKLPDVGSWSREQAHADYLAGKKPVSTYRHPLDGVVTQFACPDTSKLRRVTSLRYSTDAKEVLASYIKDYIYLFNNDDSPLPELKRTFVRPPEVQSSQSEAIVMSDSATSEAMSGATRVVSVDIDPSQDTESKSSFISGCKGRKKISERTREKFRKTADALKSKYSEIRTRNPHTCYQGHRNCRTLIKEAIFWGDDYVLSGSDCGRIMVWDKKSAKMVTCFQADSRVVNCLSPHPSTYCLVSSGLDNNVKLWSVQNEIDCPLRSKEEELQEIMQNNELMVKVHRDIINWPTLTYMRLLQALIQPPT